MKRQPPFLSILISSLLLALLSWGGLVILIFMMKPTLVPRWLFFCLLFIGVSSTVLPITSIINQRMNKGRIKEGIVPLRQALELGFYVCLMTWLQLGRVLETAAAIFLLAIIFGIEFLVRIIERSRWEPEDQMEMKE